MAKVQYISKSFYNLGKAEVEHLLPGEQVLNHLSIEKDRLRRAIKILKQFDHVRPTCNYQISSCVQDHWVQLSPYYVNSGINFNAHLWSPVNRSNRACKTFWSAQDDRVLDNLLFIPANFNARYSDEWDSSLTVAKQVKRTNRILEINEELRTLRQELRKRFSREVFQQVKQLVQEIHSIITFFHAKQRRHVRHFRKAIVQTLFSDIRKKIRRTIQILFKTLPDFSGCEEEARFKNIEEFKPLFSTMNQKKCTINNFYSMR